MQAGAEIQLTPTSYVVLALIEQAGEATPYALKQMVGAAIGQFFSIPHSQLYAEPERLARNGYLSERRENTGRRRKHYRLTDKGRAALEEWVDTPTADLYELRDPGLLKLAFGSDPARLAAAQLESHERRLKELEELKTTLELTDAPAPALHVLEAGIGHEREYIRFWSRLARE
jgi:PadR family transcriptional regulator AphA